MLNLFNELYSDDVFVEKATHEEYNKRAVLKALSYDPKTRTIAIGNGHRIKVRFTKAKETSMETLLTVDKVDNKNVDYTKIKYSPKEMPLLYINTDIFKFKNPKRILAMINHEIGHVRFHNFGVGRTKTFVDHDRDYTDPYLDEIISQGDRTQQLRASGYRTALNEELEKDKQLAKKSEYISRGSDQRKNNEIVWDEAVPETGKHSHLSSKEYEADAYADAQYPKQIMRALRDAYKLKRKGKYHPEDHDNKVAALDMKGRGNALRARRISNSKLEDMKKRYIEEETKRLREKISRATKEKNKADIKKYNRELVNLKKKELRPINTQVYHDNEKYTKEASVFDMISAGIYPIFD